jgi:DNA-binding CsgD family transcriptional regulator
MAFPGFGRSGPFDSSLFEPISFGNTRPLDRQMTKFNSDFWEVTISHERWNRLSTEDALGYEPPAEAELRESREASARLLGPALRAILNEVLTARQREVVLMYFFEGVNQSQIAKRLGVTQQSVSEHLYGKTRSGRSVGGAIRKIRRACAARGLRWEWPRANGSSITHR